MQRYAFTHMELLWKQKLQWTSKRPVTFKKKLKTQKTHYEKKILKEYYWFGCVLAICGRAWGLDLKCDFYTQCQFIRESKCFPCEWLSAGESIWDKDAGLCPLPFSALVPHLAQRDILSTCRPCGCFQSHCKLICASPLLGLEGLDSLVSSTHTGSYTFSTSFSSSWALRGGVWMRHPI